MSLLFEMESTDYVWIILKIKYRNNLNCNYNLLFRQMLNDTYRCVAERHKSIRSAMKFEEERTEPLTVIWQVETAEEAEKMLIHFPILKVIGN
jgi:hypothetical protein